MHHEMSESDSASDVAHAGQSVNGAALTFAELGDRIRDAVSALPLGAKRRTSKDPIQKWYPYYAGYSLEFAEAVLRTVRLPERGCVFDPWNGSGTTTLAAARLGYKGRGFDLNPIAALVARARLVNTDDAKGIGGFVREATKKVSANKFNGSDRLLQWLPPPSVAEFRWLQKHITRNLATPGPNQELALIDDHFPPLASFLLLALTRAAKSLVPRRNTSNPTVFRRAEQSSAGRAQLPQSWLNAVIEMGKELPQTRITPTDPWVMVRDARKHSLPPNTVDFTLTSPPYCTRLDYADATNFELAALGPTTDEDYQNLRKELMGAPLVRVPRRPDIPDTWPTAVQDTLRLIRSHPSKASDSYYYKTYWQYFSDAVAVLEQLHVALKPRASAALVVQSSYYKDVEVDLPSLYVEIAKSLGYRATTVHNLPVRTVISSIHPGTKLYRKTWSYRESVVLLAKEPPSNA
ncbi:MAG: hypothetical protein QM820_46450 [Minicystis sp.]